MLHLSDVASLGYGGNRAPGLEPRESPEGPLGLPRTKSCQLSAMNLSSHIAVSPPSQGGGAACMYLSPSCLLLRDQSPIYMERVTSYLRCPVYEVHIPQTGITHS